MKAAITAVIKLNTVLQQIKSKNIRAYGYFLARSKRAGRTPRYMKVVDKIFLR